MDDEWKAQLWEPGPTSFKARNRQWERENNLENKIGEAHPTEETVTDAIVRRMKARNDDERWIEYHGDDLYTFLVVEGGEHRMMTVATRHLEEAVTRGRVMVHSEQVQNNVVGSYRTQRTYWAERR